MDSYELNKIAGAVLATGLLVMALSITSEIIYEPADLRENGYVIEVAGETDEGASPEAVEAIEPIAVRLQTADASAGESAARKCLACHTFEEGGPPKVGPNLYGIVNASAAHIDGFSYSDAMMAKNSEGMIWDFDMLDRYLEDPKGVVPGTIMAFAGLKRPNERADVIAYLNTLSDSPVPVPEPPAAMPEEAAAPDAEGTDAAAPQEDTMPESNGADAAAPQEDAMPESNGADAAAPQEEAMPESSGADAAAPQEEAMPESNGADAAAPQEEAMPESSGADAAAPAEGATDAAGADTMTPSPDAETPAPEAEMPAADAPAADAPATESPQ